MGKKILIEVDLGLKAVERVEVYIYLDGKLLISHWDKSYADLPAIANELRSEYQGAEVEAWCSGLDCTATPHSWKIEV